MKNKSTISLLLITLLLTTHYSCSRKSSLEGAKPYGEITAAEVRERLEKGDDLVILDVRTEDEYDSETGHLQGAILLPVQELEDRYDELDSLKGREIVAYCRSGNRSGRAADFLTKKGFKVYNMLGGTLEWNKLKGDTKKGK